MQIKTVNAKPASVGAYLADLRAGIGQKLKSFCINLHVDIETLKHMEQDGKATLQLFFTYLKYFQINIQLVKGSNTFKIRPIGNNVMIAQSDGSNWHFMKHTDFEDFHEFCQAVYQDGMKFLFTKPTAQLFTPCKTEKLPIKTIAEPLPIYQKLFKNDMTKIGATDIPCGVRD